MTATPLLIESTASFSWDFGKDAACAVQVKHPVFFGSK